MKKVTLGHLHTAYNMGWSAAAYWPDSFMDRLREAWLVLRGERAVHRQFNFRGIPPLEPFVFLRPVEFIIDDLEREHERSQP